MKHCLILLLVCMAVTVAHAQLPSEETDVVPTVKVGKVLDRGDSILYMEMNNVYVYPPLTFDNKKQAMRYTRLVHNVKKVLPLAKEARMLMMETYEYLETLPNK